MKSILLMLLFAVKAFAICGEQPNPWYCPLDPKPNITLDGVYAVEFKVGNKVFNDIMILQGVGDYLDGEEKKYQEVTGSFEVPGVFKSKLKGHMKYNDPQGNGLRLEFDIMAKENGQEYLVKFVGYMPMGKMGTTPVFTGEAYDKNMYAFATFTATKTGL